MMSRQPRPVGRMEFSTTDFSTPVSAPKRRCRRCGAYLSSSNSDKLCFPCQRADREALWMGGSVRRGASSGRHQDASGG